MTVRNALIKGFTLIEMLLVMTIISWLIYMGVEYMQQRALSMRVSKTTLQIQEILSAAQAFYGDNDSTWPTSIACLQGTPDTGCTKASSATKACCYNTAPYLPKTTTFLSPFHTSYVLSSTAMVNTKNFVFTVAMTVPATYANAATLATIINGRLPLSTLSGTTVTAYTNIPAQLVNKAPAAHFAGTYYQGGCIPAPVCPFNMTPKVFVMVQSATGLNSTSGTAYELSYFYAFAVANTPLDDKPPACPIGSGGSSLANLGYPTASENGAQSCTNATTNNGVVADKYWRACLAMSTTQGGDVAEMNPTLNWGNKVLMVAFTSCVMNNQPSGSSEYYYTN